MKVEGEREEEKHHCILGTVSMKFIKSVLCMLINTATKKKYISKEKCVVSLLVLYHCFYCEMLRKIKSRVILKE